jgi:hypothetical protein
VASSCEPGNEPSGSIKCCELPSGCTSCGLSNGTQLHRVSYLFNITVITVAALRFFIQGRVPDMCLRLRPLFLSEY